MREKQIGCPEILVQSEVLHTHQGGYGSSSIFLPFDPSSGLICGCEYESTWAGVFGLRVILCVPGDS